MMANTILESNLISALKVAVEHIAKQERMAHGLEFKSCFRAGLETNLELHDRGLPIEIKR